MMPPHNPDVVELINPEGARPVLLLCEHASSHIPAEYAGLGLAPEHRESHAVWDPGSRSLGLALSKALDAPFLAGKISRLVYDCNRPPEAPGAMPEKSELIDVPGNRDLTRKQRSDRTQSVYLPFCQAVDVMLERMGGGAALVTVHSFTPVYFGKPRSVEIGILHDSDRRLADAMLGRVGQLRGRVVARNEPYGPEDEVTHSLRRHALPRRLANVMIEIRNDLLKTDEQIAAISAELVSLLAPALDALAPQEDAL